MEFEYHVSVSVLSTEDADVPVQRGGKLQAMAIG